MKDSSFGLVSIVIKVLKIHSFMAENIVLTDNEIAELWTFCIPMNGNIHYLTLKSKCWLNTTFYSNMNRIELW